MSAHFRSQCRHVQVQCRHCVRAHQRCGLVCMCVTAAAALPCAGSPCANDATCHDNVVDNTFSCSCLHMYTGPDCQTGHPPTHPPYAIANYQYICSTSRVCMYIFYVFACACGLNPAFLFFVCLTLFMSPPTPRSRLKHPRPISKHDVSGSSTMIIVVFIHTHTHTHTPV